MDPRYLLDTGPLLGLLRSHQPTVQLLRTLSRSQRLVISTITRLEVHAGMKDHERYQTQKVLSRFTAYPVDRDIADLAGDLMAKPVYRSTGMSMADALIAATAMTLSITLITYNIAHFQKISGLSLYPLDRDN
jgi:tRNA(fMet)-specific endonuclease VapC